MWEIRVVGGFDPVRARGVQRYFSMQGDAEQAERRRRELVDAFGVSRAAFSTAAARLSVAELLAGSSRRRICGSRPPWSRTGP